MKRVYIAGALRGKGAVDYLQNVSLMIKEADKVRRAGFAPFIPCFDLLEGIVAGNMKFEDYYNVSVEWLKVSEAVYVCPGYEKSEGVKAELAIAKKRRIPVFYNVSTLIETKDMINYLRMR